MTIYSLTIDYRAAGDFENRNSRFETILFSSIGKAVLAASIYMLNHSGDWREVGPSDGVYTFQDIDSTYHWLKVDPVRVHGFDAISLWTFRCSR